VDECKPLLNGHHQYQQHHQHHQHSAPVHFPPQHSAPVHFPPQHDHHDDDDDVIQLGTCEDSTDNLSLDNAVGRCRLTLSNPP